jgi:hypothetical protein
MAHTLSAGCCWLPHTISSINVEVNLLPVQQRPAPAALHQMPQTLDIERWQRRLPHWLPMRVPLHHVFSEYPYIMMSTALHHTGNILSMNCGF